MPLKKKLKSKKDEEEEEIEEDIEQEDEELDEDDSGSSEEIDDDDDESEDDEEEEVDGEMLMIDFEAREPTGADLESIRMMLKQKFGDSPISIDELSRIVIEQGETLGNVVFQAVDDEDEEPMAAPTTSAATSDDSDIYGVLSGVDLTSPRTKNFSTDFLKFLSKKEEINEILKSKRVFFVVNERYKEIE